MKSSEISGGSRPRADGGSGDCDWAVICAGGRREKDRNKEENAMKAPVQSMWDESLP